LEAVGGGLRFLEKELRKRLSEVLASDLQIHLLTDGKSIYLEDAPERIIDLLKDARQPMFLVCVADRARRFATAAQGKPPKSEAPSQARRSRGRTNGLAGCHAFHSPSCPPPSTAILPCKIPSVGLEDGIGYMSNPATFPSSPQIAMLKNVPFTKDGKRYFQFRLEAYNALNHHDYTGRNLTPNYWSPTDLALTNLPTGISTMTNPSNGTSMNGGRFGFGALTGAASPRRVQLGIKLFF
jgi:hypothetical protein